MKSYFLLLFLLGFCCMSDLQAQDSTLRSIQERSLAQIDQKISGLNKQLTKSSNAALYKLLTQERRMQKKLSRIDSTASSRIFTSSIDSLNKLKTQLSGKLDKVQHPILGEYNGYLDTLKNALSFLNASSELKGKTKILAGQSSEKMEELMAKIQYTEKLKSYIQERKQNLMAQLGQYTAFTKELTGLKQRAYYYSEQLRNYKETLEDRRKAEAKAMEIIRKIPAFQSFMRKHSQLASLFNFQDDATGAASLEGLQTRTQVEGLLQQTIGGSRLPAGSAAGNQMDEARSRFQELKSKFPQMGSAGEMPDFKPNEMKTKTLLQRLEFGGNIQFQRSNQFFPTTSELAGQIAYRLHKNGSIGLGASYRLGMGTGLDHIAFSNQGIGLRSFMDWKMRGTLYINAGFEENYQPGYAQVQAIQGVRWSKSALAGISKKYKINSKLNGNIMLLYDFLYNRHYPKTDPLKFRLGYNF